MEMLSSTDASVKGTDTGEDDIIPSLLNELPFKIRPDEEKLLVMQKGRPVPKLIIVKRDSTSNCNRTFQGSWYNVHKWLCGSKEYNKLFCWPCILMRPESSSWCSTGNDDMKRLSSIAAKHSTCKSHQKAIAEYDATLIGFGMLPEFVNELNQAKDESDVVDDDSDSKDYFDMCFNNDGKTKNDDMPNGSKLKSSSVRNDGVDEKNLGTKPQITFKAWQEMKKHTHPFALSMSLEEKKLFKWRKKIARQELKNARLLGQKLKIEIELLRAKINHFRALENRQRTSLNENPVEVPLIVTAESLNGSPAGTSLS